MLVLSRKPGEVIVVPECELTVTVIAVEGTKVRLGISAPDEIDVYREEVWHRICESPDQPTEEAQRAGALHRRAERDDEEDHQ